MKIYCVRMFSDDIDMIVESKTEEESRKIPVAEQFENLMKYDGRNNQ